MNHNRLRRQCSITADSQRVAVLVKTGVAVGTQWRCIDCDVPNAITTSDRSIFHEEADENTMATTVAMLERYQQPTTVAVTPNSVSDVDRSFHGHHRHRHHQVLQDGYPRSHRTKYNSVSAGSALSKSMRYADGWLYERDAGGTVGHGRSDRNKARSTFLGRDHFGVPAASTMAAKNTKNITAATTATTTPQPSLTNEDPYDRVRKNRMSGMTTPAVLAANMDRKRNRSNESSRTPSPDYDDSGGYGHVNSPSRRSILECNVNPYDLVSRQPSDCDENDDENNCPKRMSLKDKFMNRIQDTVFTKNGRATCNGVGSRFGSFSSNGSAKKTTTDRNNGVGVNIAGHTVRLSDGKSLVNNKSPSSVWYDDGSASDGATIEVENQSPVRPPRRRCKPLATTIPSGGHSGMAKRSHSLTTGAMPFVSAAEIKSILKKPVSLTTDDLSPVRSRTPIAQSTASPVTTSSGSCNGIAQKKTKKQVQFDIVSVKTAEKCTTDDDHCTKTLLTEENTSSSTLAPKSTNQNPTDTDSVVISVPERKLKRSLSDRQNSNNAIRTENVKVFNDTMRIHVRHKNRPDSRAAFERPAEPPPPPPSPPPSPSLTMTSSPATTTMKIATPLTTDDSTASITELFSCGNVDVYDEPNKTVVQVSSENSSADDGRDISTIVEPEQKTSILINSSPGLKTSVIIGEGGSAYAASADNKVTISIGPTKCPATRGVGGRSGGNYRSNVTVVDRTDSRMSDFIRMNYDPVQAARLNVTPHVCGRSASTNTIATNDGYAPKPLVSPYRVSEIAAKHLTASVHPTLSDETESSSESCYTSAKEDASYSSASLSSASSSASSFSSSSATNDGNCMCPSLHYEVEPIYEEISESPTPPPLPSCPPPDRTEHESAATAGLPSRSIFEGATKYDIINYLVDAKRRCGGLHDTSGGLHDTSGVLSKFVVVNDEQTIVASLDGNGTCCSTDSSGEDYGTTVATITETTLHRSDAEVKKASVDIERNDSGVGSETSQSSRSRWQQQQQHETQHSCEDCDQPVEIQTTDSGIVFAPLVCRKCHKRRAERREIVAEIVETEEKYGRDLDIIAEEFYRPMMVAGLLNADQLTSVFLNVSELKEHSAALSRRLRDAYEIAVEQGDDDLLTVNIGRLFLEASPSMLHAFQSYCTRQGNAALLLANLEKEKELLRIFLRVSQMENAVLRRMNLNSFLMVPVQRVTKYPLLLARLYKVTPEHHLEARQTLNEARHKIQLHLEHINSLAKDISSTKLWRKIYAINGKRPDNEDLADIKFRKVAVDVLEWSGLGEEIRFAMEGRLLYTQPSDHNWRRGGRTIKLMPINAIIVTLGKPNDNYNPDADDMAFPKQNGIRDASLVLLKEKSGRISLLREPMYLDRCVVCCENDCDDYFELHEITTKETYILKCQDSEQTKMWYRQLQYHCQTLGCWRKRRNAFANIMINRNCT